MDTPKTPDIFMQPVTDAYIRSHNADMPYPDQVVRDRRDNVLAHIFGWEHAATLLDASEVALGLETDENARLRVQTFRAMLEGMRSVVSE